ncbi:MAG TPA: glycoside hydrolase family 28 protein [Verrucomicrobiae bacterium]|nr:glycoside hydrolase family 28 protein [Verrucomicrobiae bacterium]
MKYSRLSIFLSAALCFACRGTAHADSPPLPSIPTNTFNVTAFGAIGDGKTVNTDAIQKTIKAASAAGGGVVLIPEGNFLTGPFTLASQINLHLAKGATILITDDLKTYPSDGDRYQDCISVNGAHDIEISGEGTINGQGKVWWDAFRADKSMTHRPYMVRLAKCTRLYVHGVTLCNSPMFHLVPKDCTDVTIQGITIQSPANAPNTDGIDPSGWDYLITKCTIDDGDDNIAVKPGSARSPENKHYVITDCIFRHGHGMSIGSGTEGGIEDLRVSNCTFDSTDSGIRIKTTRERGGLLQNLTYENLTMTGIKNPIYIIDWYPERTAPKDPSTEKPQPITSTTPINRNIVIRNVTIANCPTAGTIRGLPEAPITDVTFSNVIISAQSPMKIYFAKGINFIDSKVTVQNGKPLDLFSAEVTGLE